MPNQTYERSDADMCYAAFSKCGCIAAINVDRPEYAKDIAKSVASWIREGREVHRITVAEGREAMRVRQPGWGPCHHEVEAKAAAKAAEPQLELRVPK